MTKNDFCELMMEAYKSAETLIRMLPADRLDWRPAAGFMSLGQLIEHLSNSSAGEVRCLVTNQWPITVEQMDEALKLENMPACSKEQALEKLAKDKATLREVLEGISEQDFAQKMVSTPWGWRGKLERMLILVREHSTNHKMQLFTYLKLLGLPVNTETLYSITPS